MITANLSKNEKQYRFFTTCIEAAFGDNPFRYLFYGGAIRGGKTFACLITLIVLCKLFPGSKWYVLRKDFARIKETTLPSMEKILGKSTAWKWNKDASNYHVEHIETGSKIFFAGEDFARDPKLDWMLGLEVNGFVLEQIEELQEHTLNMCMSRAGSWIIPKMPMPLIIGSFNPTLTWVKTRIYDPWKGISDKPFPPDFYFEEAKATDNPFVTPEQWKMWQNMPAEMYEQFVAANWEFKKPPNVFAYAFDQRKHHKAVGYNSDYPLYLSFDFNVEPITCLAAQHDFYNWMHIVKEFRLLDSNIWTLTDHIISHFPEAFFIVTGDRNGHNRDALAKNNRTHYKVIKDKLALGPAQMKAPQNNPFIRNTRVLCNALLQKIPEYWVNTDACPHLTIDLNSVEYKKNKLDEGTDKRKGHLLDCWRYYHWTFHRDFIDRSLYLLTPEDEEDELERA